MIDLAGRPAIVVGNAEDLGHAAVRELAGHGMRVGIIDSPSAALTELAAELGSGGARVHAIEVDLLDAEALGEAMQRMLEVFGPPRFVLHNSALFSERAVLETSFQQWSEELNSILQSAFVVSKAVWPAMCEAGDGSIAYVSSGSALAGFADEAPYVAGKHGQEGLMKVLALEGKPHNIAVNTVTTGAPIDGPLAYTYSDAMRAVMVPPAALAPAFSYLAGLDASLASGQRFNAYQVSEAMRLALNLDRGSRRD